MESKSLLRQTGFTMVELMVTMVIIMVAMGGIYKVFHSNWTTYRVQEGLSRIQENGRFAMGFLSRDLREAGYRGCISYGPITNFIPISTYNPDCNISESSCKLKKLLYSFQVGIEGYSAAGMSWFSTDSPPLAGSDIIVIRTMRDNAVGIVQSNDDGTSLAGTRLAAEVTATFNSGDILMVSDCSKSRVFQAASVAHPYINHPDWKVDNPPNPPNPPVLPPEARFGTDAEIFKVATITYYIRLNPSNQPALYHKVGAAAAQELVEGVETMQVRYGEDITGDRNVDVYRVAADVTDWSAVRSVRIGLLMRTTNEVSRLELDTNIYNVLGANFGPFNDRRLRRVFIGTVALRNRLS